MLDRGTVGDDLGETIADVATVEWFGRPAAGEDHADLLVEVPHGADRRAHYESLRGRLRGPLPPDLHDYFHANTDVGAWQFGRRVAELVVARNPNRREQVVRCLVPRTFVDCNRLADATDQLGTGGLTAGLAPYIRDEHDRALLLDLHARYVAFTDRAYDATCGSGGIALTPHTYGPRSMGIARVDENIARALRAAAAPGTWETWPLRPEIDLITTTADGIDLAPPGIATALIDGYAALGRRAVVGGTYTLHPATQTHRRAQRHPGRVLCLEIRRDLLTRDFELFREQQVDMASIDRFAEPLVVVLDAWLRGRGR